METIPEDKPLPPPASACSLCCDSIRDRSFTIRARRTNCVRSRFTREYPHELSHSSVSQTDYLSSLDSFNTALQWPAWVRPIGLTVLALCIAGWVLLGIGLANTSTAQPVSIGNVMQYADHWDSWRAPRIGGSTHSHALDMDDDMSDFASNTTYIYSMPTQTYNQTYYLNKRMQGNDSDSYSDQDSQGFNATAKAMLQADEAMEQVNTLSSLLYYGASVFGMAAIMTVVAVWSSLRVMRQALIVAVKSDNDKVCDDSMKLRVRFSVVSSSLLRGATLRAHLTAPVESMHVSDTFIDKVRSIENDQAALKLALACLSPSTALSLSPNPPSYAEIERQSASQPISQSTDCGDMEDSKCDVVKGKAERVGQVDLQRILQEQAQEIVAMKRELARMRDAYSRDPHEVVLNIQDTETDGPIVIMSGQRISGATPE